MQEIELSNEDDWHIWRFGKTGELFQICIPNFLQWGYNIWTLEEIMENLEPGEMQNFLVAGHPK
jgi:predicted nucleotidyltransferase